MASLIVVNERYRFPTDPIVVLVGAFGVETLLARLGARRGAVAAAVIGIGFAVLGTLVRRLIKRDPFAGAAALRRAVARRDALSDDQALNVRARSAPTRPARQAGDARNAAA